MDTVVAVDPQFMREVNSAAILAHLRSRQSASVSTLASSTGLSRQAVSRSLGTLEAFGLIEFLAPDPTQRSSGRPAQQVRFRAEAGYCLGISINPQQVRIAVADLVGTIVHSDFTDLSIQVSGTEAIAVLVDMVESALTTAAISRDKVWFATIGAPGIIDVDSGLIRLSPSMPELVGGIVTRSLQGILSCPVYLDNDVKLATRGEQWRGVKRNDESLVFIHWGERVGAGIVLEGTLFRGAANDAGDIGYLDLPGVPAVSQHPLGLGPFEQWIGAVEVVRLMAELALEHSDDELVSRLEGATYSALDVAIDATLERNPAALATLDEIARRFAVAIAAIRVILDPHLLVIGGPMARCADPLLDAMRRHLAKQPLTQPNLAISSLGDDAVVQGAIHYCLAEIERGQFRREHRGEASSDTDTGVRQAN